MCRHSIWMSTHNSVICIIFRYWVKTINIFQCFRSKKHFRPSSRISGASSVTFQSYVSTFRVMCRHLAFWAPLTEIQGCKMKFCIFLKAMYEGELSWNFRDQRLGTRQWRWYGSTYLRSLPPFKNLGTTIRKLVGKKVGIVFYRSYLATM